MNDISYYFVGLATGLIICLISWSFGMAMEKQRNKFANQNSRESGESEQ